MMQSAELVSRRSVLIVGAALPLVACAASPRDTYRYRMTIEVETPDGVRLGSSVRQVRTVETQGILGGKVRNELQGEAVVIELPGGKTLFGLLSSPGDIDYAKTVAYRAFLDDVVKAGGALDDVTRNVDILAGMRLTRKLPRTFPKPYASAAEPSGFPLLVIFDDMSNPASVARVNADDLAATFGSGFSLRGITVQITDEPISTGIEKQLAWLSLYHDRMLDGQRLNNSQALANNLTPGSFRQGAK